MLNVYIQIFPSLIMASPSPPNKICMLQIYFSLRHGCINGARVGWFKLMTFCQAINIRYEENNQHGHMEKLDSGVPRHSRSSVADGVPVSACRDLCTLAKYLQILGKAIKTDAPDAGEEGKKGRSLIRLLNVLRASRTTCNKPWYWWLEENDSWLHGTPLKIIVS